MPLNKETKSKQKQVCFYSFKLLTSEIDPHPALHTQPCARLKLDLVNNVGTSLWSNDVCAGY